MKKIYIISIFTLTILILPAYMVFALPSVNTSEDRAGHSDLSRMASEIKYRHSETSDNGLAAALQQTFGGLDSFQSFLAAADVAEDRPFTKGMFHFYNPDASYGSGYMGLPWNARDRAKDFYEKAKDDYCKGKMQNNPGNIKKAWDYLGIGARKAIQERKLKGRGTPAPERAEDYLKEIEKIAGCTPGGTLYKGIGTATRSTQRPTAADS